MLYNYYLSYFGLIFGPILVLYCGCFDSNASGFLARECPHLWVTLATGGAMKTSILLSGIHKHMPALFSELVTAFCANDFALVMCFQANGTQVGARCRQTGCRNNECVFNFGLSCDRCLKFLFFFLLLSGRNGVFFF